MEMQPKPTVFYGEKEEKRIFNLKDGFGEWEDLTPHGYKQ